MALCLLALFGTPMSRAVAQSNDPTASVPTTNSVVAETAQPNHRQHSNNDSHDMVVIGRSSVLPAGETANDMVVIGGSATALGRVRGTWCPFLGT